MEDKKIQAAKPMDDSNLPLPVGAFSLDPKIVDLLKKMGFAHFSDIQGKSIPKLLKKKSVLGLSPTGTGKTLCYVLPIVDALLKTPDSKNLKAVILCPTVALLSQVQKVFLSFLTPLSFASDTVKVLENQKDFNRAMPRVLLSTPALFEDARKRMSMKEVDYVVIDEGDMVLFDGFEDELEDLLPFKQAHKISFFSASLSVQEIAKVKKMFGILDVVDVRNSNITSKSVRHHLINTRGRSKMDALLLFLDQKEDSYGRKIVFVSAKKDLYEVAKKLKEENIPFSLVTGDLEKREIRQALDAFKKDPDGLLLASDYASRGLDLPEVSKIISLDLPMEMDYYFHRAGRAGRFDKPGDSYLFYDEDDSQEVVKVKDLLRRAPNFDEAVLSDSGLKWTKSYTFKNLGKKDKSNDKLQKEIRHAVELNKSRRVKPNYKKKVKVAVDRVKEKHRMRVVLTNISKAGGNARDFHFDENEERQKKRRKK
ncbi:MAG: DEAD/DEAH box helicase [Bacilli bacterium]